MAGEGATGERKQHGSEAPMQPSPSFLPQASQPSWLKALGDAALAGSVSGTVARCFIHPADTVKAQLQVQGALKGAQAYQGTLHAVRKIAAAQGLSGFYKGFGVAVMGTAPGNMAYFTGYEVGKAIVPPGWDVSGDMAVGAIAQLMAGVVFNPVDIIKERLQSQAVMSKVYSYSGGMDAVRDLLHKSGPAGLLKGYWVTNAAWIPWNMMFVAMYERLKAAAAHRWAPSGRAGDLPAAVTASCAFSAAACAAAATNPVDVVKTRLQVLAAGPGGARLRAGDIAMQIWKNEGAAGFLSGCTARVMSIAPEAAIVWCMYELLSNSSTH